MLLLSAAHLLCHLIHGAKDGREVSGAIQIHAVNCVLISLFDARDSIDLRVKDVPVEGEAVICHVSIWWDGCAETEHGDLLVTIIVLKDIADRPDRVKILVLLHVQEMEGAGLGGLTV